MELLDLIAPRGVVAHLRASSKKQVLNELAKRASETTGLHCREIFDVLLERERLGSTGIGNGVAIPHGRLPGLQRITGVLGTLEKPVDFDAVDDQPVDLVFVLLAPASAGADHLKALARISRLLRNLGTCSKLRAAETDDALLALLAACEESRAA